MRPTLNDKNPAGGLYLSNEKRIGNLDEACELWVSKPKDIIDEVRVWVVGNQPVAASQYRANKKPVNLTDNKNTKQAIIFAKLVASIFLPHEHCVMDLAKDVGGKWTVIEFNPIHSSGWYATDPGEILDAFVSFYQ